MIFSLFVPTAISLRDHMSTVNRPEPATICTAALCHTATRRNMNDKNYFLQHVTEGVAHVLILHQ